MDDRLSERINQLFGAGLTDDQIAATLTIEGTQDFSSRTVRRKRSEIGLCRRQNLPNSAVDCLVRNCVSEIGFEPGRRYVKGYFDGMGLPVVGDKRIQSSLKRIFPFHHNERLNSVSRRTNPLRYSADYFGDKVHLDQNEKAVMYGLTYVAAIDGFSGYMLDCVLMPVKNPILIYDTLFRPIIRNLGVWNTVVTDQGREFALVLAVQNALTDFRRKQHVLPFRQVKSTLNNRIERYWVEHNSRITFPIKRVLVDMEEQGTLDMLDPIHRHSCSAVAIKVADVGVRRHMQARNHRHVRGRGIPAVLKGQTTAAPISPLEVPQTDNVVQQYREAGGYLRNPTEFGVDPLTARPDLKAAREDMLERFDPAEVYAACLSDQHVVLSDYIRRHIDATAALSHYSA